MKIEIEIDEQKFIEDVTNAAKIDCAQKLSKNIREGWHEGYAYRKLIKEVIREAIKENMDDLADRAVAAAAKSIENRAVKKLLAKLEDEV